MRTDVNILILALLLANGEPTRGEEPTCQNRCLTSCRETCPEKKICTENEIDCGEGPAHAFCEPDRVCVATNCECKDQ